MQAHRLAFCLLCAATIAAHSHVLESSNEPLEGLLGRLQQQSRADECDEGLEHFVELLVLGVGHLQAVLLLALLAEQVGRKLAEAGIERA